MALTIVRKMLMGLVLMGAVAGVAMAAGECSSTNPCKGGECCSQFGFCGCSDEYCGKGCINNCRPGCGGRREATDSNAGECSSTNPCKGGECCSQFGFCGCSDEYCGKGCISNCRPGCGGRREATDSNAGECSSTNPCKGGECCSQFGFCGCSDEYCGKGCISKCRPGCGGRREATDSNAGECSSTNPCKGGECCSQFGFCGCSDEYCGKGCINNCRPGCGGRREATDSNAGECSSTNPCKGGECCSQFGFCGCSDEYCGKGCISKCRPGCGGRREATDSNAGECSSTNPCKGGECCSQFGFCGCSDEYCGKGCINNCRPGCGGRREATDSNAGECSSTNPCKGGECCSQFGFCGCSDEYCGKGCISKCRPGCGGRREATDSNAGECSSTNPCKGGECCSQFGFCGCSDEYCGKGCISNCRPGCGGRREAADGGQATYYTTYVPSSCHGFDTKPFPAGNMIAAASSDVFGNRAACGTYYEITCKGAASGGRNPCKKNPTVKVMVVDLCPGCNKNSFDLSKEAFSKIADLDAGRINISAKRVSKYHKANEEDIVEVV